MQMGNIMSTTTIADVEKLIERRKWILNELRQLEEKYKMTTEEFREFVWRKLRLSKNDAKNIRKWLNLNGYIIINSSKEIIVSEDDIKM